MVAIPLSIVAGFIQALGSVFAKLAFASDSKAVSSVFTSCMNMNSGSVHPERFCGPISMLARGLLFALLIILNSGGLMLSLKGMSQVGSFLGTVLTTAANLVSTALLGFFIFSETLSLTWFCGASLIATGVILLQGNDQGSTAPSEALDDLDIPAPEEVAVIAARDRHKAS